MTGAKHSARAIGATNFSVVVSLILSGFLFTDDDRVEPRLDRRDRIGIAVRRGNGASKRIDLVFGLPALCASRSQRAMMAKMLPPGPRRSMTTKGLGPVNTGVPNLE